jgi:hypothetical protein
MPPDGLPPVGPRRARRLAARSEFGGQTPVQAGHESSLGASLPGRASARLPVAGYDLWIVVVCSEGYTSSLAAASLQDLGVRRATDLEGGFRAWRAAGLPTRGGPEPHPSAKRGFSAAARDRRDAPPRS